MDSFCFAAPKPTGRKVQVFYVGDAADALLDTPLGAHCSVPLTGSAASPGERSTASAERSSTRRRP